MIEAAAERGIQLLIESAFDDVAAVHLPERMRQSGSDEGDGGKGEGKGETHGTLLRVDEGVWRCNTYTVAHFGGSAIIRPLRRQAAHDEAKLARNDGQRSIG